MLGVSHLIIDGWAIAIASIGFVRILRLKVWVAVGLNILSVAVGVPLAAVFMRSPL